MQKDVYIVGIRAMGNVHEIFIEKSEEKGTHTSFKLR
jgi:hypothetical protein